MARSSEKGGVAKLGLLLIALGGGLFFAGIKRFRRARKVQDTPTSRIASAPQGYVEIQGNAWPLEGNGTKNLDLQDCIYRHLIVEKAVRRNKSTHWETVYEETYEQSFVVTDNSGAVLVNPVNAELELEEDSPKWDRIHQTSQQDLERKINVSGFPPTGFFGASFRFREKCLVIGTPIYVKGDFSTPSEEIKVTPAGGHSAFRKKIASVSHERYPAQFDGDKDGEVSAQEAIDAFHTASKLAHRDGTPESALVCDGEMRSTDSYHLYIADCAQHLLLKRIGGMNLLRIVGGAVLIGAGVACIIAEFSGELRGRRYY